MNPETTYRGVMIEGDGEVWRAEVNGRKIQTESMLAMQREIDRLKEDDAQAKEQRTREV